MKLWKEKIEEEGLPVKYLLDAYEMRIARAKANMNQGDLAKAMGWTQSFLSLMESGKRPISETGLKRLKRVLVGATKKKWPIPGQQRERPQ